MDKAEGAPPSKLAEAVKRARFGHRLSPEEMAGIMPALIAKIEGAEFVSARPLVGSRDLAEFHVIVHLPFDEL